MSTEKFELGLAPGALLLCRAEPDAVAAVAPLLGERMPLLRAGEGWSVIVPEGGPWRDGGEPVDRVVTGWAAALAVGAPWPVLALWWDADRAGYTLASGFRRPVGYVWLANGTPAGEDEAMRTFAARLGLDPVLDVQSLDRLTRPEPDADRASGPAGAGARARLRGLLAVLARAGITLPAGLDPGEGAERLGATARALPDVRRTETAGRHPAAGPRPTADWTRPTAAGGRLAGWMPWTGGPGTRALALAQVVVGLPLTVWGLRRRSGGWTVAGALLVGHGALGVAHGLPGRT
ncbi:hypothetical protein M4J06_003820 [Streptomyces coelicoflavus]|uniref:hypothetical protein n=1 Tax=Streptomyces coelicoflavus TaxID=285562 RepID=UPI00210A14CE|nr:hypothetical protein [Streptomyces coelicoflavus]MCQ4200339.1 hypothetical protein [Streptomyces coelicoflavus]